MKLFTEPPSASSYYTPSGLEYNLNRINIGGCDFSSRGYTYVDTVGDVALDTFALQDEDLLQKVGGRGRRVHFILWRRRYHSCSKTGPPAESRMVNGDGCWDCFKDGTPTKVETNDKVYYVRLNFHSKTIQLEGGEKGIRSHDYFKVGSSAGGGEATSIYTASIYTGEFLSHIAICDVYFCVRQPRSADSLSRS